MTNVEIQFLDYRAAASSLDAAGEQHVVILDIEKPDIECGRYAHVLASLMELSDTERNVRRFADRVMFMVSGYNEDARELGQIPEVAAYFRALTKEWPYWPHFILKLPDCSGLLVTLLTDAKPTIKDGIAFWEIDPSAIDALARHLLGATEGLYRLHGLGEHEFEAMAKRFMDSIFMPPEADGVRDEGEGR